MQTMNDVSKELVTEVEKLYWQGLPFWKAASKVLGREVGPNARRHYVRIG